MTGREKTPNGRLAALMGESGMSKKGFARRMRDLSERDKGAAIRPTHTNVDKWLSGETRRPAERTCQLMAKVLSRELGRPVTLADLGYDEAVPNDADDQTLDHATSLSDALIALASLAGRGDSKSLLVVPEAWDDLIARWTFGSQTAPTSVPEPRPVSEVDVCAVRDARQMFANFDYRYGGGRPRPLVAGYLETDVLPVIRHVSPDDPIGRAYFREVAALTRLAGWTAYDIGEHGHAQRYLYQAFRLARAAGDKALCARVLAGMSHQANFLGHFDRAVHLARAAAHGAKGHATPTVMALVHAMAARALASLGNEAETVQELSAAESWMSLSDPTNDPDWIRYFDRAELHAEFAHCFRDLGQSDAAAEHAAASIKTSEQFYVRSLSFCRTVLATAHLQAGELEQALDTARGVVDTAADLRSFRVVSYLDTFRKELDQRPASTAGREFTEYLALKMHSKDMPLSGRLLIA